MKAIKIIAVLFFISLSAVVKAQEMPAEMVTALKQDDTVKLKTLLTKENINDCYGNYSALSDAVRIGAIKCFNLLIENGADVNKSCNGYVPPLMHAAKYGHLDMVKVLVAKGADINYIYHGDYKPADGQTPITYAEMYKHTDIADYLRSVKE
jgi:ankyrin repeat protein